jgi:hypothetical protein
MVETRLVQRCEATNGQSGGSQQLTGVNGRGPISDRVWEEAQLTVLATTVLTKQHPRKEIIKRGGGAAAGEENGENGDIEALLV